MIFFGTQSIVKLIVLGSVDANLGSISMKLVESGALMLSSNKCIFQESAFSHLVSLGKVVTEQKFPS